MPLNPGNNTVDFLIQEWNGTPDRLGVSGPVTTTRTVHGCAMQPARVDDVISNTMFSEATWKCIAPANDITSSVQAEDYLMFNGDKYRIIGSRVFYDGWGRTDHITFLCKEERG